MTFIIKKFKNFRLRDRLKYYFIAFFVTLIVTLSWKSQLTDQFFYRSLTVPGAIDEFVVFLLTVGLGLFLLIGNGLYYVFEYKKVEGNSNISYLDIFVDSCGRQFKWILGWFIYVFVLIIFGVV